MIRFEKYRACLEKSVRLIKMNSMVGMAGFNVTGSCLIGEISLTSPIVINVSTRASLAVEKKGFLFLWFVHLNNKSNQCL